MVTYLYEKDLREMKLIILSSPLHEAIMAALCDKYGVRRQILRRKMIDLFDMSLLENLPARYEVWEKAPPEPENSVASAFGASLISRQIPLLTDDEMDKIIQQTNDKLHAGLEREQALNEGFTMIREVLSS
ncbi:hypothetical protein L1S32_03850 [Methanogenium sp. S4BF]|uniref:hypothetical protein n=1 Tax=Methanogenium sp. S4BF TaxID=1789226 RepID=UPI002415E43C|nr:hypothetical protein [Methanogenium sp. S4BF]WFN35264.1 hypothetical protein L1S32_03850 [Methanogenium sp. S4BF]